MGTCRPICNTDFRNVFFAIFPTSLFVIFFYCTYNPVVAEKDITYKSQNCFLHISLMYSVTKHICHRSCRC